MSMNNTAEYLALRMQIKKLNHFIIYGSNDKEISKIKYEQHLEVVAKIQHLVVIVENAPDEITPFPEEDRMEINRGTLEQMERRELFFNFILSHSIIFAKSLFEDYINNIVLSMYNKLPIVFKNKNKEKKLEYEEIFKLDTKEEIWNYIVEKEIEKIPKDFKDLEKHLKDDLCLKLDLNEDKREEIIKIFAIRNNFVHNNGVVDKKFLEKVDSDEYTLGQKIELDHITVLRYINSILNMALAIDLQIYEQYYKAPSV